MSRYPAEEMFEKFKLYCSFMLCEVAQYRADSPTTLIIKLNNGNFILWDNDEATFRNLPTNSSEMTEVQCRREFGYRLRKILSNKGLTQADLSDRTGIAQSQISGYMTGRTTPSWYVVDKIAKALNCSTEDLRYDDRYF